MSDDCLIGQAKDADGDLRFSEADRLWRSVDLESNVLLEERLQNLCGLQEEYGRFLDRKSLKFHSCITSILEVKGKQLGERKYYYRALTYKLSADYLLRSDMAEFAIDCYFRALIFQGNYQSNDGGKLMYETMQAIFACYVKMNEPFTMSIIVKDFDRKIRDVSPAYIAAYLKLRTSFESPFDFLIDNLRELQECASTADFAEVNKILENNI